MSTVYAGRWLQIDLASRQENELSIAEEDVQKWLLGDGMGAQMMY